VKPRVTIEELSRLIDGEIPESERRDLEARIAGCPMSQALRARLEELTQAVTRALVTSPRPPLPARTETCLPEDVLLRLADGRLSEREKETVEAHVLECERCMVLVLESLRAAVSMESGTWPDLPAEVEDHQQIRALVTVQEREPDPEEEGRMALVLGQDEAKTQTFGSGPLSVRAALRALSARQGRLLLTVKEHLQPKAGQEIVLTNPKTKRKFFTGRTNEAGHVTVARLPAGHYVAHFPGSQLKIEIRIDE